MILLSAMNASATTYNIEVGGNQNITPYFDPQNLNLLVGDDIVWTWVSGQHNLVTTAAPDPFDSGSHLTPFIWTKIFTVPGTYSYECSLFNHADTQFGVITVGPNAVEEVAAILSVDFNIIPNPAASSFVIEKTCVCKTNINVYDLTGKIMMSFMDVADMTKRIDISAFPQGIYFVELNAVGNISRKRLLVK